MKVLKIIGRILLGLILLIAAGLLFCYCSLLMHRKADRTMLAESGLYNPVPAGDIVLNMPVVGKADAPHTVVALPGSGDAAFPAAMQVLAQYTNDICRFAVAERPGYGISEVSKQEITPEYAVECARTALQNAGVQKPYILMPHSLGGLYAACWENKYPDEIAGILFLDTVTPANHFENIPPEPDEQKLEFMCSAGILRLLMPADTSNPVIRNLPERFQEDAFRLLTYNLYNRSLASESAQIGTSAQKIWDAVQPNDIPKIYLSTDCTTDAEYEAAVRFRYGVPENEQPDMLADWIAAAKKNAYSDADLQARSEFLEQLGNCEQVNIPADHFVYVQYPEEVAEQISRLIGKIK